MALHLPSLPVQDAGLLFAVLTAAILLAPILARRIRLPEVVVVVAAGFAIGPTGLGIVQRAGVVEALGTLGLLYLMFVAGVELDLDDFVANRRDSVGFGLATFVIPMALGTLTALALGYDTLAAVLLASCWASHTLVAYPVFRRVGTVGNRAVATSVGATILTDTAALLVLAVVARASQGALTPLFWATLLPSLVIVTVGAFAGLPRLARRFFAGWGQDPSLRFLFVLVALFATASLYELIGIEAIVGAFLAGLALNRSVPNGGQLMARVEFFGSTLFIPLFLLSTGMLIDLQVLTDTRTLLTGAAFTAVALTAKLLAALLTGRILGYTRIEIGAMFSLSAAQAAATLAAVVVGRSVGLLDDATVNAVMMVILVTCVVSPAAAGRYAPQLPRPEPDRRLGGTVVVPLANPRTAPRLMRIASAFARADGGLVVPVLVVPAETPADRLEQVRALEDEMITVAQSAGAEARGVLRIDASPAAGIVHTLAEQRGSLVVMGWTGATTRRGAVFGGIIDDVLARSFMPTLLAFDGPRAVERILLVVHATVATPAGVPALDLAIEAARLLARDLGVRIEVIAQDADHDVAARVRRNLGVEVQLDPRRRAVAVQERARDTDLVVVPTMADEASLRTVTTRLIAAVPAGASMVVALDNSLVLDGEAPATTDGEVAREPQPRTDPLGSTDRAGPLEL